MPADLAEMIQKYMQRPTQVADRNPLEKFLGGVGYGYGVPGGEIARPYEGGATKSDPEPLVGRWQAEPNPGFQSVGNVYELRWSKDYPGTQDLWVSVGGGPMRLTFGAREPSELSDYINSRVDQGWFKPIK